MSVYVYLDSKLAGQIRESNGRVTFAYESTYLQAADNTPLSLAIPLSHSEYSHNVVDPFLDGLLPGSETIREAWGQKYGVSPRNNIALLRHVGRDTAGALSLTEHSIAPTSISSSPHGRVLSASELAARMERLRTHSRTWDAGEGVRGQWSLPGAQAKLALHRLDNGDWMIPELNTPTTHILKPGIPGVEGHAYNEHATQRTAQLLQVRAAESEILTLDDNSIIYVTTRFDRMKDGESWKRIHQEDFCQALSVYSQQKYAKSGGPTVKQIAKLFSQLPREQNRAISKEFFDQLVFNTLVGNTDAHGKNYSIVLRGDQASMSPLYDSATIFAQPERDWDEEDLQSAMAIDGQYKLQRITLANWVRCGRSLGLSEDWVEHRYGTMCSQIPGLFAVAVSQIANPPKELTSAPERLKDHLSRLTPPASSSVVGVALPTPSAPISAPPTQIQASTSPSSRVWVPAHIRAGRKVKGHYRKPRK